MSTTRRETAEAIVQSSDERSLDDLLDSLKHETQMNVLLDELAEESDLDRVLGDSRGVVSDLLDELAR
jgi:hypothetical protein